MTKKNWKVQRIFEMVIDINSEPRISDCILAKDQLCGRKWKKSCRDWYANVSFFSTKKMWMIFVYSTIYATILRPISTSALLFSAIQLIRINVILKRKTITYNQLSQFNCQVGETLPMVEAKRYKNEIYPFNRLK